MSASLPRLTRPSEASRIDARDRAPAPTPTDSPVRGEPLAPPSPLSTRSPGAPAVPHPVAAALAPAAVCQTLTGVKDEAETARGLRAAVTGLASHVPSSGVAMISAEELAELLGVPCEARAVFASSVVASATIAADGSFRLEVKEPFGWEVGDARLWLEGRVTGSVHGGVLRFDDRGLVAKKRVVFWDVKAELEQLELTTKRGKPGVQVTHGKGDAFYALPQ